MKLIFSIFLIIFCSQTFASMILIKYENKYKNALLIQDIFVKKYSIPRDLILIKKERCLESKGSNFLELCINKKGELLTLSSDIKFKVKSLSIFRQP